MKLAEWLKLPEIRDIKNLDDPATTLLHSKILRRKTFLKKLYADFYRQFGEAVKQPENKVLVELGSGSGFIKEIIPNAITSDILNIDGVDKVFSATDMPFENKSVDAFFMFDVLHHIDEPRKFFSEAERCLRPAGRVVMIEPANTPWARFIYKNFHHERFDVQGGWQVDPCQKLAGAGKGGPLTQANGALPWIIFVRDRIIFEQEYPRLKVVSIRNHTPFRYLFSGGFTLRQLAPGFLYSWVKAAEFLLTPANNRLGMFMTVILEKTKDNKPATK
jgi:SAM-dependent methyltransferase